MIRLLICFGICFSMLAIACTHEASEETQTQAVAEGTEDHHIIYPDEIEWHPAPPLEQGAEIAILEGDPLAEGELYTLQLKLPADFSIAPHTHPVPERVLLLSGSLYLGHDTEMNKESAERVTEGSYFTVPPEMIHYVISGNEGETILHITSVGPFEMNYVNEEDDPRLRAE